LQAHVRHRVHRPDSPTTGELLGGRQIGLRARGDRNGGSARMLRRYRRELLRTTLLACLLLYRMLLLHRGLLLNRTLLLYRLLLLHRLLL
jgi:hypothetical protein